MNFYLTDSEFPIGLPGEPGQQLKLVPESGRLCAVSGMALREGGCSTGVELPVRMKFRMQPASVLPGVVYGNVNSRYLPD